jgi:hypothetical protein
MVKPCYFFDVSLNQQADKGAPTPEATPRLCAAGTGGATTAKTCVCAAKLRRSLQLFESTSPRGALCFCADEAGNIYYVLLLIYRVFFSCCGIVASTQETAWAPA